MKKHCPQLRTQLQELKSLFSKYCLELEKVKNTKEYEQAWNFQKDIESNINNFKLNLIEHLAPLSDAQIEFRYQLAKRLNLKSIDFFRDGVARVEDAGGEFFININGESICGEKRFLGIEPFSEGLAYVNDEEGFYYINKEGQAVFGAKRFTIGTSFHNGLAAVQYNDRQGWFFINKQGELAFDIQGFGACSIFLNDFAHVQDFGKGYDDEYYFINKNGQIAFGGQNFHNPEIFVDGLARVTARRNGGYYFINEQGKSIKGSSWFGDHNFRDTGHFSEGLVWVEGENTLGGNYYIDKEGHKVFDNREFAKTSDFSNGLAFVQDENEPATYYIDRQGKQAFGGRLFRSASTFSEGLAYVQLWEDMNGEYSFINTEGQVICNRKFDSAASFREGVAVVEDQDGFYFIDKQGQVLCGQKRFKVANSFFHGLANVTDKDEESYFIDHKGRRIG